MTTAELLDFYHMAKTKYGVEPDEAREILSIAENSCVSIDEAHRIFEREKVERFAALKKNRYWLKWAKEILKDVYEYGDNPNTPNSRWIRCMNAFTSGKGGLTFTYLEDVKERALGDFGMFQKYYCENECDEDVDIDRDKLLKTIGCICDLLDLEGARKAIHALMGSIVKSILGYDDEEMDDELDDEMEEDEQEG